MPAISAPLVLDLLLRGADAALLLLVGAILARDHARVPAGRLGAAFALGSAAYALCSTPVIHALMGGWSAPLMALASGNNLVFWLFAQALFDDRFVLRPWHGGLWAAIVAADFAGAFGPPGLAGPLGVIMPLQALGFAGLAAAQAIASWREDLVERRRRLRLFVVAAAAGQTAATALVRLVGPGLASPGLHVADALVLTAIAVITALALLRVTDGEILFPARADAPAPTPAALDSAELSLVRSLERLMREERAYRDEGLTIGRLAQQLNLPEYRLRRLINQGLGHRNFSTFLNGFRLEDARSALADPTQASVPILTIALDAGFGSLGPFNRAFRAETGVTPTEYRRLSAVRAA